MKKVFRRILPSVFLLWLVVSGVFVATNEVEAQTTCASVVVAVTGGSCASANIPVLPSVSGWFPPLGPGQTYVSNCSYPGVGSIPACQWACINGTLTSRVITGMGTPVCPVGPHPIAPTVTLDPFISSTITTGQSSTISFSSTDATACTGTGVLSGSLGTSATNASTGVMNTPGSYTQSVTCTGTGGSATSVTRTLTVTNPVYSCISTPPANATTHAGDDTGLSANTVRTFSAANTTPKCQYACNPGYTWNGSACVVNGVCYPTHYACTAGTSANNVSGLTSYTWNCNGTSGGTNALCSELKPTGTVVVTSNIPASWTITGPMTISGAGTTQTYVSRPVGTYTITWGSVPGYVEPVSSSFTLTSGGTISFSGTYTPAPCSAGTTLNWSVGGNTCTGTTPATNSGLSGTVTDSTVPTTGSAAFSCTNGAWAAMPNAGATCALQTDLTSLNFTHSAGPYTVGTQISLSAEVINSGLATIAPVYSNNFSYSTDNGANWTEIIAFPHISLPAGDTEFDTSTFTLTAAGNLLLRYCVDSNMVNPYGEIDEGPGEGNNCLQLPAITVVSPPSVNLTVAGCSVPVGADECTTAETTWTFNDATPLYRIINDSTGAVIGTAVSGTNVPTTLQYGANNIEAYHNTNDLIGGSVYTTTAGCVANAEWSVITSRCELTPIPIIIAIPPLIRWGQSTSVTISTNSLNPLTCDIYGATASPEIGKTVISGAPYIISPTKDINAKQQVLVECIDSSTGLAETSETYIEVVPKMREI